MSIDEPYTPGGIHERNDACGGDLSNAHRRFRCRQRLVLPLAVLLSVTLHFGFLEAFPALNGPGDLSADSEEMKAVEMPPETRIPPPPRQVRRPASPTVADAQVSEDITIEPMDFDEEPPPDLPPPPDVAGTGSGDRPSFIPRDVDPKLVNGDELKELLERFYPADLKNAGIGGRVVLWLFVDSEGNVVQTRIQQPSGYDSLDEAAREVAVRMKFEPAQNRDKPIGVWVAQPVRFSSSGGDRRR